MTPDELIAAVRARLDDIERKIIAYRDGHSGPCVNYEGQNPAHYDEYDSCVRHIATVDATPYRDAEFGLRQVAADREIVDMYETMRVGVDAAKGTLLAPAAKVRLGAYERVLRALARVLGIDPESEVRND